MSASSGRPLDQDIAQLDGPAGPDDELAADLGALAGDDGAGCAERAVDRRGQ
jgi:hypothetical protein